MMQTRQMRRRHANDAKEVEQAKHGGCADGAEKAKDSGQAERADHA